MLRFLVGIRVHINDYYNIKNNFFIFTKISFQNQLSEAFSNTAQQTADLVTFTEEILNGKLHFCAVSAHLKAES